ncbi:MAG: hypothetical protein HXM03_00595 [[Eubacterium] sulci]|jgi:hypothetical protein|nr:hypothetical protein [[Eubacterium] sulci]
MRYTALITFIDAETGHEYVAGDVVDTSKMSEKRIDELASENNRAGMPIIVEEDEEDEYDG